MLSNIGTVVAVISLLLPYASGNGLTLPPCCPTVATPAPTCPPPPGPPLPCPVPRPPQVCPPPPVYSPAPLCPTPPPPPQPAAINDCCSSCQQPCKFKTVRRALGSKTSSLDDILSVDQPLKVSAICNSEELRTIMQQNMNDDVSESKQAIKKSVEEQLEGSFSIACATGGFSYVVRTSYYCQETRGDVTCYVFRTN